MGDGDLRRTGLGDRERQAARDLMALRVEQQVAERAATRVRLTAREQPSEVVWPFDLRLAEQQGGFVL